MLPLLNRSWFKEQYTFPYEYEDGKSAEEVDKRGIIVSIKHNDMVQTGYIMTAKDAKTDCYYHAMFEKPRAKTIVPKDIEQAFNSITTPPENDIDNWQYVGDYSYDVKPNGVLTVKHGKTCIFIYPLLPS